MPGRRRQWMALWTSETASPVYFPSPSILACSFSFLSFFRRLVATIYSHSVLPPSPPPRSHHTSRLHRERARQEFHGAGASCTTFLEKKSLTLSLSLSRERGILVTASLARQVSTRKVVEGLPKTDVCPWASLFLNSLKFFERGRSVSGMQVAWMRVGERFLGSWSSSKWEFGMLNGEMKRDLTVSLLG